MVLFPVMRPVFRYLWRKFPGDALKRSDAERHVVGFVYSLIKAERAATAQDEVFDIRELLTSLLDTKAHRQHFLLSARLNTQCIHQTL